MAGRWNDTHIDQTLDAIRKTKKTKIDESIELNKYLKEIKVKEEDLADRIKKEIDLISKSIDLSSITILFDRNDIRAKTIDALIKKGVKLNEYSINTKELDEVLISYRHLIRSEDITSDLVSYLLMIIDHEMIVH